MDSAGPIRRRTMLAGVATAGATLLAGCGAPGDDPDGTTDDDPDESEAEDGEGEQDDDDDSN